MCDNTAHLPPCPLTLTQFNSLHTSALLNCKIVSISVYNSYKIAKFFPSSIHPFMLSLSSNQRVSGRKKTVSCIMASYVIVLHLQSIWTYAQHMDGWENFLREAKVRMREKERARARRRTQTFWLQCKNVSWTLCLCFRVEWTSISFFAFFP